MTQTADKQRGVYLIHTTWNAPSELWLHRIRDGLEDCLVGVAAYDAPYEPWRGHVPTFSLNYRWWRKLVSLFNKSEASWGPIRMRQLQRELEKPEVQVVYCHYALLAYHLRHVLKSLGKPVYVHCHGYDVTWDLRRRRRTWSGKIRWKRQFKDSYALELRALSNDVTFIANSSATKQKLLAIGIPEQRIVVHYYGVPVPLFSRAPRLSGPVRILYLGRLIGFKGPLQTIEAFELACQRGLDGELKIAGDGPLRAACEQRAARSPVAKQIRLLGVVDAETGQRLRCECDVFTAHNCTDPETGQEEAFGVSILEAMADGIPVVTGRSGGVVDSVVDDQTGILFEPNDISAHAAALLRLSDAQLRLRMGKDGWERASREFALETHMKRLRSLLTSAATEP